MKKYCKMLSFLLAIAMIFTSNAFAYDQEAETAVDGEKTAIIFKSNATVTSIAEIIDDNGITVDGFTTSVVSGDNNITCGFVVKQQDAFSNLWDEFVEQQTALLTDAMIANAGNSEILADIYATQQAFETNNIQIVSVVCDGDVLSGNNNLAGLSLIQEIEPIETSAEANDIVTSEYPANAARATSATNWLPTSGTAYVWPSGSYSDATYLQVDFKWNSASALSTLTNNSNSTLEAEIVLYNYNGEAISDDWNTNYAYTTNQPRAYRDTQAFDDPDECCFTVGCSSAQDFVAGTQYYWYAYGNRTTSSSCNVKVYFQRGHRFPAAIYDTAWNVFADETTTVIRFNEWNTATATYKDF